MYSLKVHDMIIQYNLILLAVCSNFNLECNNFIKNCIFDSIVFDNLVEKKDEQKDHFFLFCFACSQTKTKKKFSFSLFIRIKHSSFIIVQVYYGNINQLLAKKKD